MMRGIWIPVGLLLAWSSSAWSEGLKGRYDAPLGEVELVEEDGWVRGRLVEPVKGCDLDAGTVVLEGSRLADTVHGLVRTCTIGTGCAKMVEGMAMLLVTQDGGRLSGAVHLEVGSCQTPLGGDALVLVQKTTQPAPNSAKAPGSQGEPVAPAAQPKDRPLTTKEILPSTARSSRAKAQALAAEGAKKLEAGAVEDARERFLAAVRADPTYSEGLVGVGVSFYLRARYDEALTYYKQALEANPSNRDAYYNTACIYALRGDTAQALRFLQIAVLNGYVQRETFAADPDLQSLHGNAEFERLRTGGL